MRRSVHRLWGQGTGEEAEALVRKYAMTAYNDCQTSHPGDNSAARVSTVPNFGPQVF